MTPESAQLEFTIKRSATEVWWVYVKRGLLRPRILLGLLFILVVAPLFAANTTDFFRSLALFTLLCAIFTPILFGIVMWRVIASDPTVKAANVAVFGWGIRVNNYLRSVSLSWANYDSFVETRKLIVMDHAGKRNFGVIPKRNLDAVQLATLLTILSQHLRRR